jgi:hypothetical protein
MSTSKLDIEIEDEDSNNEQLESENESDEDHTPESRNLQEDDVPDKDAFLVDRESKKNVLFLKRLVTATPTSKAKNIQQLPVSSS